MKGSAVSRRRNHRLKRLLLAGICLAAPATWAQPGHAGAKAIEAQMKTLRALPDDIRAATTKSLALEIRDYPPGGDQVGLAMELSSLATEEDFGRGTLQQVADTLARAVEEQRRAKPAADLSREYAELARLSHYEGAQISSDDPRFEAALAGLKALDVTREQADLTLADLHGKSWTLKRLRGRVVLVNFWATWCPPCRKEMPDLEKLHQRFEKQGLVILALSDEPAGTVEPYAAKGKYTYPILLDAEGAVKAALGVQGIPQTLVYDRGGKLVAQSSDMRTMSQFEEMLAQAGLR